MGTLYLVATPIGNLDDISHRAIETLRNVDLIAAEDTRVARILLRHFYITTPVTSLHGNSSPATIQKLLSKLEKDDIAVVSDAGMPGISDPGSELVRAAIHGGNPVIPIPGPSAVIAAAAVSGAADKGFIFVGYLPRKAGPRRRRIGELLSVGLPVIVFESPRRVQTLLQELAVLEPAPWLTVGREISKVHEEWLRGTPDSVLDQLTERGEFTLVITPQEKVTSINYDELDHALSAAFEAGASLRDAVDRGIAASGLSRREVYQRALMLSGD